MFSGRGFLREIVMYTFTLYLPARIDYDPINYSGYESLESVKDEIMDGINSYKIQFDEYTSVKVYRYHCHVGNITYTGEFLECIEQDVKGENKTDSIYKPYGVNNGKDN